MRDDTKLSKLLIIVLGLTFFVVMTCMILIFILKSDEKHVKETDITASVTVQAPETEKPLIDTSKKDEPEKEKEQTSTPVAADKNKLLDGIIEHRFVGMVVAAMEEYSLKTPQNDLYIIPRLMDRRDAYLYMTTAPYKDGKNNTAYAYTFPVQRVVDGKGGEKKRMHILFQTQDKRYKVLDVYTE